MQVVAVALPGDPLKVDPGARLDSPSTASTTDRRQAMPTRSFGCGRGPTIAGGGRSGKERPQLSGCWDSAPARIPKAEASRQLAFLVTILSSSAVRHVHHNQGGAE